MWSRSQPRTDRRPFGRFLRLALPVIVATAAPAVHAGEVADAVLTMEAISALPGEQVATALPLRFVLLESGQVFVGGTSALLSGKLSKDEMAALERRMNEVRKLPGLASTVTLGPGPGFRLSLRKPKPLDILVQGDPAAAPTTLLPLGSLVRDLGAFGHASLRPYEPTTYVLGAREGKLTGGCRAWTLPVTLVDAVAEAQVLASTAGTGWPTGAIPAQVCVGDKTFVVTLRPLVPGEKP